MLATKLLASVTLSVLIIGTLGCAGKQTIDPAVESSSTASTEPPVSNEAVNSNLPIISSTSSPEVVASRARGSEKMAGKSPAPGQRN